MALKFHRVLLTGGAGFIGSHAAEALLRRGADLTIVDNLDEFYPPAWKRANLKDVQAVGRFAFEQVDIADFDALRDVVARSKPEAIVHLAARAGVRPSIEQPRLYESGNVDVALSHAQIARQKMPDSPNVADTLGWAYFHKGIYGQAITYLEEAVKGIPNNPTFHYHLGRAYQKANDQAKARQHLKRALELKPKEGIANECRKLLTELGG